MNANFNSVQARNIIYNIARLLVYLITSKLIIVNI